MKLNALLMSRNPATSRVLSLELNKIGIESEWCSSAQDTMELLVQGSYSGLVIDFDLPESNQVAKVARMLAAEQRPVIFAMIGPGTPIGGTFQSGANFVLYKPLESEQITRTLRAGRGFMQPNRRKSPRHRIAALVHLEFPIGSMPAIIRNLSEQGLALQAPEALPKIPKVPLRFALAGSTRTIQATGEVIWSNQDGRAGMFFSHIAPSSRKYLKNWLSKRGVNKHDAVRILMEPREQKRLAHSSN
ncbi:MAG: hypothetical protein NVS1B11_33720 [Terriglobales bacterium]